MTRLLTIIRANWIAFTIAILAAITVLSLWPLEELPPMPGTDKIHHFVAYAVLMLPTALRKPEKWILVGLFFVVFGGAIELTQPYANRHGEWTDMLANGAGIVCGCIVGEALNFVVSARPRDFR